MHICAGENTVDGIVPHAGGATCVIAVTHYSLLAPILFVKYLREIVKSYSVSLSLQWDINIETKRLETR